MLALKNGDGTIAIFMKVKKALIWRLVLSKLLTNLIEPLVIFFR